MASQASSPNPGPLQLRCVHICECWLQGAGTSSSEKSSGSYATRPVSSSCRGSQKASTTSWSPPTWRRGAWTCPTASPGLSPYIRAPSSCQKAVACEKNAIYVPWAPHSSGMIVSSPARTPEKFWASASSMLFVASGQQPWCCGNPERPPSVHARHVINFDFPLNSIEPALSEGFPAGCRVLFCMQVTFIQSPTPTAALALQKV